MKEIFDKKSSKHFAFEELSKWCSFFSLDSRSKFEDKGRFVSYLKPIPVYIVVRENLGLLGAAKKLGRL